MTRSPQAVTPQQNNTDHYFRPVTDSTDGQLHTAGDISKQSHVKEVMRKRIQDWLAEESRLTEHEGS